jgi:DNA polymerase
MFIGEAPGRLGAERTGIPFFGDRSGKTFEFLLRFAGLSRESVFITNAVLCNPRDNEGLNDKPSRYEVSNCSSWLRRTILVVDPVVVVTLGSIALEALKLIERHELILRENVGRVTSWFNRHLIPLYHPGPRALIHRDIETQKRDYRKLKRFLRSSIPSEKE